ncbi:MAG: class 1 isoprenoid biosynthesis enzyme [Bacteroidota bacterium]
MNDVVRGLKSKYTAMFLDSSPAFPQFTHRFTSEEQRKAEREIESFIDETTSKMERSKKSGAGRAAEVEKLKASVKAFIAKSMCSPGKESEIDFLDDFSEVGDEFVRRARAFDPHLTMEDIHQALRNVWIVNSFQVFLGKDVALTPSGFAYSLLYPYTDNYLDDPTVRPETKADFVQALGRRLAGENVQAFIPAASRPFDLIEMIEEEYPRQNYPEVFGSLLAIHNAQVGALAQQRSSRPLNAYDILDMSVGKGGTSVLADAYVAAGILEDTVEDFAFGFGVCLQLMDDLQDFEEDLARGHQTLMTRTAVTGTLSALTNQLINFTASVIASGGYNDSPQAQALLDLSHKSCLTLILEATARASDRYTEDYLTALEAYSPLRFSCLKSLKENLKQKSKSLRRFESAISAGAFTGW